LLFAVPIALAAMVVAFVAFGMAAGSIWLFVAGDNAWPAGTDTVLVAVFVLAFAGTAAALVRLAYIAGKRREGEESGNARPALVAGGATALLVLAMAAYQWHVGNIGPKVDSLVCSEYCAAKGFSGSSMPPRNAGTATCGCIDAHGHEAIRTPMDRIGTGK
jgi:hypothetical protein